MTASEPGGCVQLGRGVVLISTFVNGPLEVWESICCSQLAFCGSRGRPVSGVKAVHCLLSGSVVACAEALIA